MAEERKSREASPQLQTADCGRKRAPEAADVVTVTDEEVEEFWAILRRIRRPVKCSDGGRSAKLWRPSFLAEDFNDVSVADGGREEKEKEKGGEGGGGGLDLNVDPLTE